MNPLEYIEHGSIHFVTTRTEQVLPFLDDARYPRIFESMVGRAQYLYPTTVMAYHPGANYRHMLVQACDPEYLPLS